MLDESIKGAKHGTYVMIEFNSVRVIENGKSSWVTADLVQVVQTPTYIRHFIDWDRALAWCVNAQEYAVVSKAYAKHRELEKAKKAQVFLEKLLKIENKQWNTYKLGINLRGLLIGYKYGRK